MSCLIVENYIYYLINALEVLIVQGTIQIQFLISNLGTNDIKIC